MVIYQWLSILLYDMEAKGKKGAKSKEMDPDTQLKKLGTRIKTLRIQAGYSSYEQFAYENGISRAQFGRYEQGKDIRLSTLIRVVNALGMTLDEFFDESFQ